MSIERQLHVLEPVTTLDARVREAVESSIVPVQKQRERRNIYIFLILVLLLIVNLSPIPLSYLVERYFNVLGNSTDWTSDSPAWMILFGSFAVVLLILFASSLLPIVHKYLTRIVRPIFLFGSSLLFVILVSLGYYWRENAVPRACYPVSCGFPQGAYAAASIAFNLAPIFGGLLLVEIFYFGRKVSSGQRKDRLKAASS